MRIVALLTVRNEALVLGRCLQHLADQGVETCLIDHGSDDNTLRIAEAFLGRGVFRIELQPYTGIFSLEAQLRQKEQLATEIDADWFMHLDADEIRQAPPPYGTLHDAVGAVDRAGWNAIDFDEFVFVPTSDEETFESRDFVAQMRCYYYFEPMSPDRLRINAWKKQPEIDLHTHAGHQVMFSSRRVCPQPFILRHYLALSRAHLRLKYGDRRFAPAERARHWHTDRVCIDVERLRWPASHLLKHLDAAGTFDKSEPWQHHFWETDCATSPPVGSAPLHEKSTARGGLSVLQAFKEAQGELIPSIAPDNTRPRPLWSVMIPTFNPRPAYLREALAALLAQDPGPSVMQIEVVDDHSTVDVSAIVRETGLGRIDFSRQQTHAGMVGNWNACVERARGEWVHLLHQDDRVLPGFYEKLQRPCENVPELVAAFCRGHGIDDEGQVVWVQEPERSDPGMLVDFIAHLATEQRIITPAIVVRRRAYEEIGGYHLELPYCADWDFYKRLAVLGPIWYEPASLAGWRQHSSSSSTRLRATGADLADRRRSIELSRGYLPAALDATATQAALRGALIWAADILRDALLRDELSTALTQAGEIVDTLRGLADSAHGRPVSRSSPAEYARLRTQIDELEGQVQAWMLAAQQLAGRRTLRRSYADPGPME